MLRSVFDESEGESAIFLIVLVCTALAGAAGCSTPELVRGDLGYGVLESPVAHEGVRSTLWGLRHGGMPRPVYPSNPSRRCRPERTERTATAPFL